MATKPTTVPRWAETAGGTPASNITTPASGEQDTGWTNGQNPASSGKMNFLQRLYYDWILYLRDAIFVATAASGLAGVSATGDGAAAGVSGTGGATGPGGAFTGGATGSHGATSTATGSGNDGHRGQGITSGAGLRGTGGASGPGVAAVAGGGGAPVTGALNLTPQIAPTTPANGDIWATAASLFARINGVTRELFAAAYGSLQFSSGLNASSSIPNSNAAGFGTTNFGAATMLQGPSAGVTYSNTVGSIQVAVAGVYEVILTASLSVPTTVGQIQLNIWKNAVGTAQSQVMIDLTATAKQFGGSTTIQLTLAANDSIGGEFINSTGAGQVFTGTFNLTLKRIA